VAIAISLQTRKHLAARTIAAHLTLESDRILRQQGCRGMLTVQQVKSLLTTVVSNHLHKLNRLAALEAADGINADDGRRSDLIMGWALRLKAARGPEAVVEVSDHPAICASGLAEPDVAEINQTIALLRGRRTSDAPPAKILRLLEDCGASQTTGDVIEAETIWYRGQAAALMAVHHRRSGRYDHDDKLVNHILSEQMSSFAPVASAPVVAASATTEDVRRFAPGSAPVTQPEVVTGPSVSILRLTERLIEEKAGLGEWRTKTQEQVRSVAELFVKMIGGDDTRLINQSRVADFRTLLLKLPKTYGKNPKDFDRPLADHLEQAKKLPPAKVGRQGGTINSRLNQLKSVIEYVETSGNAVADYAGVEKLRAKTRGRPRNERNVLSVENLRGIFAQAPWTGCASEKNRMEKGPLIIHDALYWVPIVAKATLGRREEICGLDVDDVLEEDGIPYIYIRPNAHRLLKNPQSLRRVPLIGEVMRLNFLKYRDIIMSLGYKLLFPELKANSDKTPLGDVFHGEWIKVQDTVIPDAEAERKAFHSIRKTSASELKDKGVASELRADVLGHGGGNITEERYASSAKLQQMLTALEKLPNYTGDLVAREIRLHKDVQAGNRRLSAKPRRRTRADET